MYSDPSAASATFVGIVKRCTGAANRPEILTGRAGVRRTAAFAERQKQRSIGREFLDGVVEIVRDVDSVIRPDRDPVRPDEDDSHPTSFETGRRGRRSRPGLRRE